MAIQWEDRNGISVAAVRVMGMRLRLEAWPAMFGFAAAVYHGERLELAASRTAGLPTLEAAKARAVELLGELGEAMVRAARECKEAAK